MNQVRLNASPHPAQKAVHDCPARFRVLCAGRRFGKTRLGVMECIDAANRGGVAWWVSPTYKMSDVGWRPLRQIAGRIPTVDVSLVDRRVRFPGGGSVTVRSADNPNSLRGEGLDFLVMDECAYIAEDAWVEALRPALSDRKGRALFISTPRGRNWFWKIYQRGLEVSEEWASFTFPTSANPYIDPAEIEAARITLPELTFEQEYLAQFLENSGTVFRNIAACMGAPANARPEDHAMHRIVMGGDWGKQADFTALSIGCATCKLELHLDRFNKIDYHFQRERLGVAWEVWQVGGGLLETNSIGTPNLEELQRSGYKVSGFETTAASKPPLIENLALTLEKAEWQFLPDPVARGELEAYERTVSPITGRSQYSAPVGMHDDTVIARALMLRAAEKPPTTIRSAANPFTDHRN